MAEAILLLLLEKLATFAQDEIPTSATAKAEVEKLEAKLKAIQPIARDAHNKQFFSREVKDWVWRLNEVAYDALDVIDLYRINCRRTADPADSSPSRVRKTLNSIPKFLKEILLHHKTGAEIKNINERLNVIYEEKNQYGLLPMLKESSSLGENLTILMQDRLTTSAIKESKIIGREEDEEAVIKWLSEKSNPDEESASVIAIVGMGGIGKTALAQYIYHDTSVQGCFDTCMWVCVAEMPKLLDLLNMILEEVTSSKGEGNCSNQLISVNTIHMKIRNHLKNKKFLLVLDDVWDYGWWGELRSLWQDCGLGSKVLITTRQIQVAKAMGLTHSHELKCLNEEQSWHLFLNKALRRGESEEHLSEVKDVGRDIARKCGGLPLALSAVGSLLRQKERRKFEWQNVLYSPLWNWQGPKENNSEVFAAIALSYMSIPYQLKQCLTYCCMYPKDFEMEKEDLARLWVAEGFILKEKGVEMEVNAKRCLDALVGCSLVQDVGNNKYKLHDIVHDFGLHLREKEFVIMGQLKNELVSHHARYVSSVGGDCCCEALRRQDKLRGLMCHEVDYLSAHNFNAFRCLRVLDLRRGKFSELPESIGDLILLKYINLSHTRIHELPESISKLLELQTLDLSWSDIRRLPNKISALVDLRHLGIYRTELLKYLPSEIGKLTALQTLPKFIVGSNKISEGIGCSLRELHDLNNLKGYLRIEQLQRVDNFEDVDHAQIRKKTNLQTLGLFCDRKCKIEFKKDVIEKVEQVYERMQPPIGIEDIRIDNYPGMKCPTWMSSSIYSSLKKIVMWNCAFLESLPNLGLLPNLVMLYIHAVNKVKVLNFTLNNVDEKITFPKLEMLRLISLESLEEWQFDAGIENMPCLRELCILQCPRLRVIPFISNLEKLIVENVLEWEGWFMKKERDMPCLQKMDVSCCGKLKLLPNCPQLERLSIEYCNQLVELPRFSPVLLVRATVKKCLLVSCTCNIDVYEAKELEYLEIVGCPKLESLLQGLQCGNLKTLVIKGCPNLTSIAAAIGLKRLEQLVVEDCTKLLSIVGCPIGLKRLSLGNLPQLQSLPMAFLDSIKGLEELDLVHKLGSLQVEELLAHLEVTRLSCLKLTGFQEVGVEWLKQRKGDMVQLKELIVEDCPKLLLSIADVLKEYTLPKLQLLRLARLARSGSRLYASEGLICDLIIDSVEMSEKLTGLMLRLSNKVKSLAVSVLPGVDSLPNWIQQLHHLQWLTVYACPQLTHLPHWLNKLSQLDRLELDDLPELVELPATIKDLHQLDFLKITTCPKLSSVFRLQHVRS